MDNSLENPTSRCTWVVKDDNGGGLIIGGYPYLEYKKTHPNLQYRRSKYIHFITVL